MSCTLTVGSLHFRLGVGCLPLVGITAGVVRGANAKSDGVIVPVQVDTATRGRRSFEIEEIMARGTSDSIISILTILTVFRFGSVLPPHSVCRPAVLVPVGIEQRHDEPVHVTHVSVHQTVLGGGEGLDEPVYHV